MSENTSTGGFIGLWIIDKESGLPLISVKLGNGASIDSTLFGGFLVAIRGMMTDFEIGQLNSFQTDAATLLITGSEEILSVIAIQKSIGADCWYPTLLKIQNMIDPFYTQYKTVNTLVDTSDFEELYPQFRELILVNIKHMDPFCYEKNEKRDEKAKAKKKLEDSGLW